MSMKVMTRVWEQSEQRSTAKLLLLALADFANDEGVCWPGAAKLADKLGETERNTRQLLKKLVDSGELICLTGGGRGVMTVYGIASGLDDAARERLNRALENTAPQNSVSKTLKYSDQNSVKSRRKTVKSGDRDEPRFAASPRAKTAVFSEDNHHGTVMEPEEEGRPTANTPDLPIAPDAPTAPAAAQLCNYPPRMTAHQRDQLAALVAFLEGNAIRPERVAAFGEWWRTKSWVARSAARDRRKPGPPTPRQVMDLWPEFDVQKPAPAATPPLAPALPDEPPISAADFARRIRDMPKPEFARARGARG